MDDFGSNYIGEDPRVAWGLVRPVGTILSDVEPEVRRGMVRNGIDRLARSHDLPYTLASMVRRDSSGLWAMYLTRSTREGPPESRHVECFDFVQRHVQRAITLRLKLARARLQMHVAAHASGGAPPALLLIDRGRRLCWAGPLAEHVLRLGLQITVRQGRVSMRRPSSDRLLERAMRAISHGVEHPSLQVPARPGEPRALARSVEVLPYRPNGWLASGDMLFLLVVRLAGGDGAAESRLTPHQRVIFGYLAQGMSNREIAGTLSVSVNTVRNHVQAILERLGARNRTECAALAHGAGVASRRAAM
jgi:DNA-binding CsgD family transcriptional regulator